MAGAPATRSRRRQAAAAAAAAAAAVTASSSSSSSAAAVHADRARPDTHVTGRANKHHHQDAPQSKPKSADSAKAKAEQEYMERLNKEFFSLPEREVPPSDSSSSNHVTTGPRPSADSMSSTNVAITKTIRSAIADMRRNM